jgi:anthranilate 1,2-dioxygenase large subunit
MQAAAELRDPFKWPTDGVIRAPYRLFSDPDIYELEQTQIFRGPVWSFLCLEVEIPNPGDYRTTTVGETPVVVTRDGNGAIHAMVNRCAHKGALVCLKKKDNVASLSCVYHAWNYDLDGQLRGVAFRHGIRGQGGMPSDFDAKNHRLQPLKVEAFCGMIFGTFADDIGSVESYLGAEMAQFVKRNLGRPLRILGTHSQITTTGSSMPRTCATPTTPRCCTPSIRPSRSTASTWTAASPCRTASGITSASRAART